MSLHMLFSPFILLGDREGEGGSYVITTIAVSEVNIYL